MSPSQGRKASDPDYGVGEHSFDCDDLELVDEQELTARLVAWFQDSPNLPRLPSTAMELYSLLHTDEIEFDRIEAMLEGDALLAGEVLGIARSAFYAGVSPIRSLREALVRIGLEKLREIVVQAAINLRIFRSKAYAPVMERLKQHGHATAHLARLLSRYTPIDEDYAFLCGLLHDVGIAGILLALGDLPRGKAAPSLDLLWPAIHAVHAEAGARMVRSWGLAADVALVVQAHHTVCIGGVGHPCAAVVCLAEWLTGEVDLALVPAPHAGQAGLQGLGTHLTDRSQPAAIERARLALGLSEPTLQCLREDVADWMKARAATA